MPSPRESFSFLLMITLNDHKFNKIMRSASVEFTFLLHIAATAACVDSLNMKFQRNLLCMLFPQHHQQLKFKFATQQSRRCRRVCCRCRVAVCLLCHSCNSLLSTATQHVRRFSISLINGVLSGCCTLTLSLASHTLDTRFH